MLLIYRLSDGRVMSGPNTNSAYPEGGPFDQAVAEVIAWAGGTPADYGELRFHDEYDREIIQRCFAAGSLAVVNGQLVIYDRLMVDQPAPALVGDTIELVAHLPADSPDTEVTFALDGEAVVEPVVNGQASHLYQFTSRGTYPVTVSSAHHGTMTLEVIVR